jgi:hypothetical protein
VEEQPITHCSLERLKQVNRRRSLSWQRGGVWPALALLLLALAACSPGASTAAGSNPQATSTHQTAPIHVPQGYHGMIVISFDTSKRKQRLKAQDLRWRFPARMPVQLLLMLPPGQPISARLFQTRTTSPQWVIPR